MLSLDFGVNVHTDESLLILTMYCAESVTTLWFIRVALSESTFAITTSGVTES